MPNFRLNKKTKRLKQAVVTSIKIIHFVWQVNPLLFIAFGMAMIFPAIIPFVNMYIYKLLIDMLVAGINGTPIVYTTLYTLIALRFVTYFLQEISFRTQSLIERILWVKIPILLSETLLAKIASLDIHYFERSDFKDTLEKINESYKFQTQNLVSSLFYALQGFTEVVIASIAITRLQWPLTALILFVAILGFFHQYQFSELTWGIWSENSPYRKRYKYLADLLQSANKLKEIKMFQLQNWFLKQIVSLQERYATETIQAAQKNYVTGFFYNILTTGTYIGIEVFIFLQALAKKITIGDIGFYTGVVGNFQNGRGGLFRNINAVLESSLYVSSIFEVLEAKPYIVAPKNPIRLNLTTAPKIEFRDVTFTYPGNERPTLDHFSLAIEPGQKVAFVGENGAGKSTMIKLLVRFYDVTSGEILINDINIKNIDLQEWYQHVGALFQDFNRYEYTVKENISFGNVNKPPIEKNLVEAAEAAGAHRVIQRLQQKYEQMLGRTFEGGVELSAGQWQKLALARSFFRNAPVLILDEPTASIDAKAESEIFESVEKLSRDKTVIIISHRFSTVRNADVIYVIDDGKIIEHGTHQSLLEENGRYAGLFHLQAKGYK